MEVRRLVEDFARYVYLPRLRDPSVLVGAVSDGAALPTWEQDSFAYADGYDEASGRYRGLRVAQQLSLSDEDPHGLLVKPDVARVQLEAEAVQAVREEVGPATGTGGISATAGGVGTGAGMETVAPPRVILRRFHGSIDLNPMRPAADAGRIAEEVIAHLAGCRALGSG